MAVSHRTELRDALSAATDSLAAAGAESPRLDAELMFAAASGHDRAQLAADADLLVEPSAGREFAAMVRRRLRREPVAYILGSKGFRHITLACDRRALIPRPETELLVEIAVELRPHSVLDVGTGTGAVALAIANELESVAITASDTSEAALDLARENARRLGLDERVRFSVGMLPAPEAQTGGTADAEREPRSSGRAGVATTELMVANLPYVPDREWESLSPEITEFEPREALLGGPDGLDQIRALLSAISEDPPEAIAVEVGLGQASDVEALVLDAGFARLETRPDLAGIDRVVIGHR